MGDVVALPVGLRANATAGPLIPQHALVRLEMVSEAVVLPNVCTDGMSDSGSQGSIRMDVHHRRSLPAPRGPPPPPRPK